MAGGWVKEGEKQKSKRQQDQYIYTTKMLVQKSSRLCVSATFWLDVIEQLDSYSVPDLM